MFSIISLFISFITVVCQYNIHPFTSANTFPKPVDPTPEFGYPNGAGWPTIYRNTRSVLNSNAFTHKFLRDDDRLERKFTSHGVSNHWLA